MSRWSLPLVGGMAVALGAAGAVTGVSGSSGPAGSRSGEARAAIPRAANPSQSPIVRTRGDECPTGSGTYCSDTSPVCCMIRSEWVCKKRLSDCTE